MIDLILSLPTWAGGLLSMLAATALGLPVYICSHKLITRYQQADLKDPTSSLFRLVGLLVSLMLSLAFTDVVVNMRAIENAIEREAVAISDAFHDLQRFDTEKTRETRAILIEYLQSIIDDDWPALANDTLSQQTDAISERFEDSLMQLEPATANQKQLWSRILADLDAASDYRMVRLANALAKPPVYLYVVILGFLITMAFFGAYRPQPPLVVLASLYTLFIGLVLYLILALSDPFQGGTAVEPTAFEHLVVTLRADSR
jgi:hypothetical protein